jgi:hypothetical protein
MACEEPIVGGNCKMYYNSATYSSPTWVEMTEVGDVSIPDLGSNLAEINTRSSKWTRNLAGQMKLAVEFTYLYKADTTVFDFLRALFFSQGTNEFAVMDGAIATAGTEGLRFPGLIENFPINQNLEEVSMVDTCRLALAYMCDGGTPADVVDPAWMVVSS